MPLLPNKNQAIHNFWSGFGIPAYDENSVPDDAVMPYITYEVSADSIENIVPMSASLWYHSTSWKDISDKAQDISEYIGYGGIVVPIDVGRIYIWRGTPFSSRVRTSDSNIKSIYMNISCEFLTDK